MIIQLNKTALNNATESNSKRALTIAEAAKYCCVSRGIVESWIVKGLLPYEELPSNGSGAHQFRRVRRKDLDEFLDRYYHNEAMDTKSVETRELILLPRNP